jgi:hypothetical protein
MHVRETKQTAPAGRKQPLLGVYCGNDPKAVLQFENWLGRKVDGILGYTGGASWADYDGSVGWAADLWRGIDRTIFWSVPLIPKGATLGEAARGEYNGHYRRAAETLATFRPQEKQLYLRTGWEFNGDWMPWTAQKHPAAFAEAFRQFATTFRGVSKRFLIEWNVNIGEVGMNPEKACPGDRFVDLIGMDFYWQLKWDPTDPKKAWDHAVSRPYGLQWHQAFAHAHGKPTTYSEWGISSNVPGPYLKEARAWFDAHPVVFHSYWNSNADYPGLLSEKQYTDSGTAFRELFAPRGGLK